MPVFALLIISKAGSLIYHRTFPTSSSSSSSVATATSPPPPSSTGTLGLPGTSALTTNDYLVLAGTFHGVHAITKSLTPKLPIPLDQAPPHHPTQTWTYPEPHVPPSGIESMESSFFRLTVQQTATGTKFLLFTDPSMSPAITETIMRGVYERYADHVCKNPFWQMEMPIRLEGWDREIAKWLSVRR